ncbi:MAG: TVP38/TMEM64 family protein [Planctomycetota bacterium]|nr:MAG: TVP38/TMEM64 family protein [Planctomycetota bacterium]
MEKLSKLEIKTMQTSPTLRHRHLRSFKILILLGLLATAFFLFTQIDIRELIVSGAQWIKDLGWKGMFLYGSLYFLLGVFSLPASLITISAGFLFGFFPGVLIANLGSTLGAAVMFILGRFLFRDFVERQVEKSGFLKNFDTLMEKRGFKIVLLARLAIFMPYGILNYAFSATKIPLRTFVLGSMLGMLPGSILYILIGTSIENLSDLLVLSNKPSDLANSSDQNFRFWYFAFMGVGILAMFILLYYLGKIATLSLKDISRQVHPKKEHLNQNSNQP